MMSTLSGKTCPRCEMYKPSSAFNKNRRRKDGMQTYCRDCQRIRDRENYAKSAKRREQVKVRRIENNQKYATEKREYVANYLKTHPCVDCGETNLLVLQFDHVHGKKIAPISEMVYRLFGIEALKAEIEKCDIRCANCHTMKTARDFNYRVYARYQEMQDE